MTTYAIMAKIHKNANVRPTQLSASETASNNQPAEGETPGMADIPEKKIELARRLLAVAEHPNTDPVEADTYRERAYGIMAKYGIDYAVLADSGKASDEITTLALIINGDYQHDKSLLLAVVADAKRCRSVEWKPSDTTYATVVGYSSELQAINMLYSSLNLQMLNGMRHATPPEGSSLAKFRNSWRAGFITRVHEKLREAEGQAIAETVNTTGRSTELVLHDRQAAIQAAFERMFPNTETSKGRKVNDANGYYAGREAGDKADIGTRGHVGVGAKRALTR